jgi:hypothetical protein
MMPESGAPMSPEGAKRPYRHAAEIDVQAGWLTPEGAKRPYRHAAEIDVQAGWLTPEGAKRPYRLPMSSTFKRDER